MLVWLSREPAEGALTPLGQDPEPAADDNLGGRSARRVQGIDFPLVLKWVGGHSSDFCRCCAHHDTWFCGF